MYVQLCRSISFSSSCFLRSSPLPPPLRSKGFPDLVFCFLFFAPRALIILNGDGDGDAGKLCFQVGWIGCTDNKLRGGGGVDRSERCEASAGPDLSQYKGHVLPFDFVISQPEVGEGGAGCGRGVVVVIVVEPESRKKLRFVCIVAFAIARKKREP